MSKVSIIVPTYNRAAYLEKVIKSIVAQGFIDYEIIITDNYSTDNTEELVKSLALANIVYCKNEQNLGMINNHNRALELVTGDYIHIFSDDDIMKPGSILKKAAILDAYPTVGLVHSDIEIIDGNDNIVSGHWAKSYYDSWLTTHSESRLFKGKDYFKILYYHWNVISMPSVMIRSAVLKKVGNIFNPRLKFAMDLEMWMRICLFSDVFYLNEKLVQYRVHASNNILKENESSTYNEFLLIKKILFEKFSNELNKIGIYEQQICDVSAGQVKKYPVVKKVTLEMHDKENSIHRIKRKIKHVISKYIK